MRGTERTFILIFGVFVALCLCFVTVAHSCDANDARPDSSSDSSPEALSGTLSATGDVPPLEKHKICYMDGSTVLFFQRFEPGSAVVIGEEEYKHGFEFLGWSYEKTLFLPGEQYTMPAEDVYFSAVWVAIETKVILNPRGGAVDVDEQFIRYSSFYRLNEPVLEGSYFAGWYLTPDYDEGSMVSITGAWGFVSDIVLYAKWSDAPSFEVSFTSMSGSGLVPAQRGCEDDVIILPECGFQAPGLEFEGWLYDRNLYQPGDSFNVPGYDVVMNASWKPAKYMAHFIDGHSYIDSFKGVFGTEVELSMDLTKRGYVLIGWDCDGSLYEPNLGDVLLMPAYDIWVSPVWVAKTTEVTLEANGGSVSESSLSVKFASNYHLEAPVLQGKHFGGWFITPTFEEGTMIPSHGGWPLDDGELTIYAKWSDVRVYEASFDIGPHGFVSSQSAVEGGTIIMPDYDFEIEGHDFEGWYYEGNYYQPGDTLLMPDQDIIILLKLVPASYTLTFIVDEAEYASYEFLYSMDVESPSDPTKEGYTFIGWSPLVPPIMPGEDMVLEALWQINEYTLTFISEGKVHAMIIQDYGTEIDPPEDPVREGYTFIGWSPSVPDTMPGADIVYTASWSGGSSFSWTAAVVMMVAFILIAVLGCIIVIKKPDDPL